MEERLQDKAWRRKHSACAFLSLVPLIGFFGFLLMGKKAKRKTYTNTGWLYGGLILFACVACALGDIIYHVDLVTEAAMPRLLYVLLRSDLPGVAMLLMALLWVVVAVHTLASVPKYLRYLALEESLAPPRHVLTGIKKWRRRNLTWTIWSWLPVAGMLSTGYGAVKTGNRKLRNFALASGLTLTAVYITQVAFQYLRNSGMPNGYHLLQICVIARYWLLPVSYAFQVLFTWMLREDYLDTMARKWEADTHRCPNLSDPKWQRRSSAWQIWTGFPLVNGIGILLAGRREKSRKRVYAGVLVCFLNIVLYAGPMVAELLWDYEIWQSSYAFQRYLFEPLLSLARWVVYLLTFWYGCLIRWDVMKAHAMALQGYSSEIDREIDLRRRMAERQTVPPVPAVAPAPVPIPEPASAEAPAPASVPLHREIELAPPPAPAAAGEKVDINRCTQSELMTLPGISVAQAKKALEYRSANGPFRSVDEFVEVLAVKPHFAVQLFRLATAEEPAAPAAAPQPRHDSGPARRRIDF